MNEDEAAVRQVVDQWMSASRAGDTQSVLQLMTDDVLFMVPGREPFGKAEFKAASEAMKNWQLDGKAEVIELQVCDGWAWLRTRIVLTVRMPGSGPMNREGQTLTIVRKEADGKWRIARDANFVT